MISAATRLRSFFSSPRRRFWAHIALILLAGTAVYINSLAVPFVMDDQFNIRTVGARSPGDLLLHGGARRIVDMTFALNYRFSGFQVTVYHLTNLAIHLASAVTLYFLALAALAALHSPSDPEGSATDRPLFIERFLPPATALLFVCHPLQTQAVTYIVQRYTSLATLFYLLSACAYIRARLALERQSGPRRMWLWGGACLLSSLLAFGSKQISYTLPFMLLLLELCLFRGRLLGRRFLVFCGTLLMAIAGVFLYHWLNGSLPGLLFDLRHATSEDYFASRSTYFLTQLRVVATYLRLLCLPLKQNLLYDYPFSTSFFSPPVLASAALHTVLIISAVVLLCMSGTKRSAANPAHDSSRRLAALGILWFYLALSVESSFIPILDVIFEHRVYLPSVGFFMAVTALAAMAVRERQSAVKAAWMLLTIICLAAGGMTIARNRIWNDSLSLWQDIVSKSPNRGLALANLANEYLERHLPAKALPLFVRAIESTPNLDHRAVIGLGETLKRLRPDARLTTGQELMLKRSALGAEGLDYSRISEWEAIKQNNLGLAHTMLGEWDKARSAYNLALYYRPSYDLAWYNLGALAVTGNDTALLDTALEKLRTLNPALATALAAQTRR